MTGTEELALVRYLIMERIASKHSDPEIQVALNAALEKWTSRINESNWNYYIKSTTVTISASTRTATLPSDCSGRIFLIDDPDSNPILGKDFAQFKATDTANPARASIIGPNTIYFESSPGSDHTVTVYYYYVPTAIDVTDGSTEIDFPKNHHSLLAYEAAVTGMIRDRIHSPELWQERMELQKDLINEMDSRRIDGTIAAQSRTGQSINITDV